MKNFEVNKKLLPVKGHYFLWNAGSAPIVPFMSVYAKQLGFSSFVVGIIYTILPFSGMLAKPIMGTIADRFKCRKIIFLAAQLVAAVAFCCIIFLPELPQETNSTPKIHFSCDNSEVAFDFCNDNYDDRLAENLQNKVCHTNIMCTLNCPLELRHWDIVCKHWDGKDYCNTHPKNLEFTAHVPMNLTVQFVHCVYFRVKNVTFQNGNVRYPNCPANEKISTNCDINCDSAVMNNAIVPVRKTEEVHKRYEFWLLLSIYLIAWIGQAVTVSVADTLCFQLLGDKPHKYGYQRMFGALGWGIFSIISGVLVDHLSNGDKYKNYSPVFGLGVGITLLCILVSSQISYVHQHTSTSILKDVGRLLMNVKIFVFILWCICMGLCTALMWNFLFWLLEELAVKHSCEMMSWIKTIEGLVMGIQCLGGELPFFFFSSWILRRIGHVHSMSLVLLVLGLRFLYYSFITNPWWCLPIEICQGLTFGLFYATMASYASIVAPPGTETTIQGLVGALFEGVGVSLGSFLGGLLMENYGGSITFRIFGIGALIACLLHAFVQFIIQRIDKNGKDSMARYATPEDAFNVFDDDDDQELRLVI